ncbi:MAG: MBL fold metallo-hydrolase [Betaproteobacteria bacterium]|nr:MAG: MBL fold metallo-hydrolase [Betaproteobacteria bacterium]
MEIAPCIHNILTDLQHATGVTNTYLIVGSEGAAFVDAGWDRPGEAEARIAYWEKLGKPALKGIAVTHRHPPHWGNAPAIQRACGNPPIIATFTEKPEIDARMQGATVDRPVRDGETLSLGSLTLEFVEAPGHTYGSMAVFIRETRALFTGDNVMGTGSSVVNPGEGEISLYLQTLDKFLRYEPAVIYPGQGPVVTNPRSKLEGLIRHHAEREQQIVSLMAKAPCSIEQLFAAIYPDIREGVRHLARNQIRSHLIKLEKEGRVVAAGDVYRLSAR